MPNRLDGKLPTAKVPAARVTGEELQSGSASDAEKLMLAASAQGPGQYGVAVAPRAAYSHSCFGGQAKPYSSALAKPVGTGVRIIPTDTNRRVLGNLFYTCIALVITG